MFRLSVLSIYCLGLALAAVPVNAHQVKLSGEVGGTLHIEPNDVARAGQPTSLWFAVTRKGGSAIALDDCSCQLALYRQPQTAESQPVAQPPLVPVSAEGYRDIPGAEVVFPEVGSYILVLTGAPQQPGGFEPFELPFEVTVAAAAQPAAENSPAAAPDPAAPETPSADVLGVNSQTLPAAAAPLWRLPVIAGSVALVAGLVWSIRHRRSD